MRIAYFDCFSGISGDMTLGALIDAGLEIGQLRRELSKLGLSGFQLECQKVERHGITGTQVDVVVKEDQNHRHLAEIIGILDRSSISGTVKEKSKRIFIRLAEAEAKVHGTTPDKVHFHEVGALDAIVDVVGSVVGLELLGVERVYASPLRFGTGFIECSHGTIPIPAPAVVELSKGIPAERTGIRSELVTPTGAAILTSLAESFGDAPIFRTESIGYGAGRTELEEIPNLLRVQIGELMEELEEDHSVVIETNIDDMTPEVYGYITEVLFDRGAKDVFLTPIVMKKGRPGVLLSVLTDDASIEEILRTIFRETTTLGVRMRPVRRMKVKRSAGSADTVFGPVRTKIGKFGGRVWIAPEFDDCARIARERGVPILEVYKAAQMEGQRRGQSDVKL